MAITGSYSRTLDEKQRIAVPKRLRVQFADSGQGLYVAPESEHSLGLYSSDAFDNLATRLAQKTTNRAEVRNYLRLFYARAERVDLDGQGRIRIPDRLVEGVLYHHNPSRAPRYKVEAAVTHVADILAQSLELGNSGERYVPPLDNEAWKILGLSSKFLSTVLEQVERQASEAVKVFL